MLQRDAQGGESYWAPPVERLLTISRIVLKMYLRQFFNSSRQGLWCIPGAWSSSDVLTAALVFASRSSRFSGGTFPLLQVWFLAGAAPNFDFDPFCVSGPTKQAFELDSSKSMALVTLRIG